LQIARSINIGLANFNSHFSSKVQRPWILRASYKPSNPAKMILEIDYLSWVAINGYYRMLVASLYNPTLWVGTATYRWPTPAHPDHKRRVSIPMTTDKITQAHLNAYRSHTYRTLRSLRLQTLADAIEFVNQRGFVTLWPIKGIELPSLWTATAGPRPVAAEHDDPGHITWGWKDQMLDQRQWFYAKLLRGKATFVSLAALPNFYALSPREADLDDYRQAYRAGTLSYEALQIADALLEHGAMDSILLRRRAGLRSAESKSRFDRGLTELQKGLWILPIGVAEVGSWHYAFIYELLDRWLPDLPSRAGFLSHEQARANLILLYLCSVGMAEQGALKKVFGWRSLQLGQTLASLQGEGAVLEIEQGVWAGRDLVEGT
jgi:hypothetical protein